MFRWLILNTYKQDKHWRGKLAQFLLYLSRFLSRLEGFVATLIGAVGEHPAPQLCIEKQGILA